MKLKHLCSLSLLTLSLSPSTFASNLSNFNEPNSQKLIKAIQNNSVHLVQIGDSHTAADEMTDALRQQLQSRLGNGGMGWGMPMYFTGHRLVRYGYDNSGWQPISSRTQHNDNYAFGGLLAVPQYAGSSLTIKAKKYEAAQKIKVSIRQAAGDAALVGTDAQGRRISIEAPVKNGSWQMAEFNAQLPFTLQAQQVSNTALGGWWAQNENGKGAVVSAIGINGAQLSIWNRWNRQGWQQEIKAVAPDLMVLAYGTNEAYNNNLDVDQARQVLIEQIRAIRQASPATAIMLVSAPESLKNIAGSCGTRPIKLSAMQQMQREVAQQQNTLFWDWQQAMGGSCSMKSWINQGDARRDGVHFSASGYQKLGQTMAQDILSFSGQVTNPQSTSQGYAQPSSSSASPNTSQSSAQYGNSNNLSTKISYSSPNGTASKQGNSAQLSNSNLANLGYAKICIEGTGECKSIGKQPN
ncbi:lysophospholipase L1-like esterase [Acinetobacter calcoaceticus]|uniref:Lysophospholipase L1-like esterase n=1 Tax=Acinetobacter calcoaceticus TaxID=471 RepID=A0A4R1XYN3_ACICA|nr:lysophospholipase L1-like esterase [Acinetobacter calcoaceticus]